MKPTREQIQTATREQLRVWVAEELGWEDVAASPNWGDVRGFEPGSDGAMFLTYDTVPNWPGDIGQAWELAEKLYTDGWGISLGSLASTPRGWRCIVVHMRGEDFYEQPRMIEVNGDTAPAAICKAWLMTRQSEAT